MLILVSFAYTTGKIYWGLKELRELTDFRRFLIPVQLNIVHIFSTIRRLLGYAHISEQTDPDIKI